MNPKILLFDEPAFALTPEMESKVLEVMTKMVNKELIMLVVAHEMRFARKVNN